MAASKELQTDDICETESIISTAVLLTLGKMEQAQLKVTVVNAILAKISSKRERKLLPNGEQISKEVLQNILDQLCSEGQLENTTKSGNSQYKIKAAGDVCSSKRKSISVETEIKTGMECSEFSPPPVFQLCSKTSREVATQTGSMLGEFEIAKKTTEIQLRDSFTQTDVEENEHRQIKPSHFRSLQDQITCLTGMHLHLKQQVMAIEKTALHEKKVVSTAKTEVPDNVWNNVKKGDKHGIPAILPRNERLSVPLWNRFTPLSPLSPAPEPHTLHNNISDPPQRQNHKQTNPTQVISNGKFKQFIRPSVVLQENPENNIPPINRVPKKVPGPLPYNRAHIRSIKFVTDSIMRSVRVRRAQADMEKAGFQNVSCSIHKFPGATALQLQHYSRFNVEYDTPHGLVINGGTNSLARKPNETDPPPSDEEIVDTLCQIGIHAKTSGVKKVFVPGITIRKGNVFHKRILNINALLEEKCKLLGFYFIKMNNINMTHLMDDGLHLNSSGTALFMQNILNALY